MYQCVIARGLQVEARFAAEAAHLHDETLKALRILPQCLSASVSSPKCARAAELNLT